jgi:hypothetical protein
MADFVKDKWQGFLDYCRSPAVPYQKVRCRHCPVAALPALQLLTLLHATLISLMPNLLSFMSLTLLHATYSPSCHHPRFSSNVFTQFGESTDVEPSNKKLYAALAAEFLGMVLFALYGGEARDSAAAYGNGLTLAVLVYATANISGGHLNPAVTAGAMISGHISWRRGLLYMLAQFLGGITGKKQF